MGEVAYQGGYQQQYQQDFQEQPQVKYQKNSVPFPMDKSIPGFVIDENTEICPYDKDYFEGNDRKKHFLIFGGLAVAAIAVAATCVMIVARPRQMPEEPVAVITNEEPVTVTNEEPVSDVEVKWIAKDMGDLTARERDAIRDAQSMLNSIPYSRKALKKELMSEYQGYSESEAEAAVGYLETYGLVDWQDECNEWALEMVTSSSCSKAELNRMLTSDYTAYTQEQVTNAIEYLEDNSLVDWGEQAKKDGELYLEFRKYTREDLIDQLVIGNEYTQEEAEYAADALSASLQD